MNLSKSMKIISIAVLFISVFSFCRSSETLNNRKLLQKRLKNMQEMLKYGYKKRFVRATEVQCKCFSFDKMLFLCLLRTEAQQKKTFLF